MYFLTIVRSLASEFLGWSWKTHIGIPMLDIGINHDCEIFKYFPPIIICTNQGLSVLPVSENVEYSVG